MSEPAKPPGFNPLRWVGITGDMMREGTLQLEYSLVDFLKKEFTEPEPLIETLVPRGGATLVFGLPKGLKSWFALSVAISAAKRDGKVLGVFNVAKPVRTLLAAVEDQPTLVQHRLQQILTSEAGMDADPGLLSVIPRCGMNLADKGWRDQLTAAIFRNKSELVILDVFRRLFRGEVNSTKEISEFLEWLDEIRRETSAAIMLLHHAGKQKGEIQTSALGSIFLTAWADVLAFIKNKTGSRTSASAEVEIESKLSASPDPMRFLLDFDDPQLVTLEPMHNEQLKEAEEQLAGQWTVRDVSTIFEIGVRHARRIIAAWQAAGQVERVSQARPMGGGFARFRFTGAEERGEDGAK